MKLTKGFVLECRKVNVLRDFLCQAIDQVDQLEESQRWRKFPEEKPEWGKDVLIIDKDGDIHIVRFSHDFKWISWGKMNTCESDCVIYWMPLPKKPEEADK